ncbi:hypothetical protein HAX54_006911 [Datura stramonium]|uniref:Uncharacterized protein n=1 Tax=Datura stramonium TaxID=4076 RepID=A0ABS8TBP2_DATST|nr:hypothetical protein [Datura stramonium]
MSGNKSRMHNIKLKDEYPCRGAEGSRSTAQSETTPRFGARPANIDHAMHEGQFMASIDCAKHEGQYTAGIDRAKHEGQYTADNLLYI